MSRSKRRRYTNLIISLTLLLIVIIAAVVFGSYAEREVRDRIENALTDIQQETDVIFTYERLYVDLFSRIRLEGVQLGFSTENGKHTVAQMEAVTVSYSLMKFLFLEGRKDTFIDVESLSANLDPNTLDMFTHFVQHMFSLFDPVEDFYVHTRVDSSQLSYTDEHRSFSVHIPNINSVFANLGLSLDVADPIEGTADIEGRSIKFSTPLSLSFTSLEDFSADIPDLQLSVDGQQMPDTAVSLSREPTSSAFRAAVQSVDLAAALDYHPRENYLAADVSAEDISLDYYGSLLKEIGLLAPDSEIPAAEVTVKGSADYDLELEHLIYDGVVSGSNVFFPQFQDSLTFSARVSGTMEHIIAESLDAQTAGYTINGNISTRFEDLLRASGHAIITETNSNRQLSDIRFHDAEGRLFTTASSSFIPDAQYMGFVDIQPDLIDLSGKLSYRNLSYDITSQLDLEEERIALQSDDGTLRLNALKDESEYTVVGALREFQFPVAEFTDANIPDITGSMNINGTYLSRDEWSVRLRSVSVEKFLLGSNPVSLSGTFDITPETLQASELVIDDGYAPLGGSASAVYSFPEEEGLDINGNIRLSHESESYTITGGLNGGEMDFSVEAEQIPAGRYISSQDIEGLLGGSLVVTGTPDNFEVAGDLELSQAIVQGVETEGNVSLNATNTTIHLTSSSFSIDTYTLEQIDFRYESLEGTFDLSAQTDVIFDELSVSGGISASGKTASFESLFGISFEQFSAYRTTLQANTFDLSINDEGRENWDADIVLEQGNFSIATGEDRKITLEGDVETGEFSFGFYPADFPLSMDLQGTYEDGTLNATSENLTFDPALFNMLEMDIIQFSEGRVEGNITITGAIDDLEYYGELLSDEITFSTSMTTGEHVVSNVYVSLIGKEIIFAPFVVETQNSFADAQLSFFIEDIAPQSIDLSLDIPRSSLISVRQEFADFNLAYYGGLAGEVSLFGYFNDLSIDGDLFLDRGTLSQPVQAPAPVENEAITQIDLSITAGKNLTGVFPTVDLPILVARIQDGETIDITANLAQERFSVSGEVDIRGGEIVYFQRNFFIVDGKLNLQLDQNNVDPRISLTAKLKDFDREGNKVDIFLSLNNDRIDNLSPSFYARPDKTLAEISEILGRNIIPTDILGSSNLSAALAFATLATDVIQQVGLIQLDPIQELEVSIRNSLNLDLFSIRTMVFQNILLDTIPGEFSSSYSRNPIARYLDNTTLLLGKYVTDDMFLQAIIQLSVSDEAGVGLFFTNELGLDIELSYEWNNPLYNLSIATQPEAFSFRQLLDSISIGVAWSYSF